MGVFRGACLWKSRPKTLGEELGEAVTSAMLDRIAVMAERPSRVCEDSEGIMANAMAAMTLAAGGGQRVASDG